MLQVVERVVLPVHGSSNEGEATLFSLGRMHIKRNDRAARSRGRSQSTVVFEAHLLTKPAEYWRNGRLMTTRSVWES